MPIDQLHAAVNSLVLYALLELVSLLALHIILKRWLGISGIAQLAFVLEDQWGNAQIGFMFWVLYNAQPGLQHYGALISYCSLQPRTIFDKCFWLGYDYTLEFAWLHGGQNS